MLKEIVLRAVYEDEVMTIGENFDVPGFIP